MNWERNFDVRKKYKFIFCYSILFIFLQYLDSSVEFHIRSTLHCLTILFLYPYFFPHFTDSKISTKKRLLPPFASCELSMYSAITEELASKTRRKVPAVEGIIIKKLRGGIEKWFYLFSLAPPPLFHSVYIFSSSFVFIYFYIYVYSPPPLLFTLNMPLFPPPPFKHTYIKIYMS